MTSRMHALKIIMAYMEQMSRSVWHVWSIGPWHVFRIYSSLYVYKPEVSPSRGYNSMAGSNSDAPRQEASNVLDYSLSAGWSCFHASVTCRWLPKLSLVSNSMPFPSKNFRAKMLCPLLCLYKLLEKGVLDHTSPWEMRQPTTVISYKSATRTNPSENTQYPGRLSYKIGTTPWVQEAKSYR